VVCKYKALNLNPSSSSPKNREKKKEKNLIEDISFVCLPYFTGDCHLYQKVLGPLPRYLGWGRREGCRAGWWGKHS
jgi:hypothetical protein